MRSHPENDKGDSSPSRLVNSARGLGLPSKQTSLTTIVSSGKDRVIMLPRPHALVKQKRFNLKR